MKPSSALASVTSLALALVLASCTSPKLPPDTGSLEPDKGQEATEVPEEPATVNLEDSQLPETVLVDEADLTVTVTGLDTSDPAIPKINVSIANKATSPRVVQAQAVSVNGYMVDAWLPAEVDAGTTVSSAIELDAASLARAQIYTIRTMELSLVVFDGESWEQLDTYGPFELVTSADDSSSDVADDSGEIIYETEGITIKVCGITDEHTPFGTGQSVVLEVTNGSDETVTVSARDAKLNGEPVSVDFSALVSPGKRSVALMSFDRENDTGEIESVEASFTVFATERWEELAASDPITFEP